MAQFQPEKGVSFIVIDEPPPPYQISLNYPSAPYDLEQLNGLPWPHNEHPEYVNLQDIPAGASLPEPPAASSDEGPKGASGLITNQPVRKAFIRKVFLILTCQLTITVAFIALFFYHEPLKSWIHDYWRGRDLYIASYVVFFTLPVFSLGCESKSFPCNVVSLVILTVSTSLLPAVISSYHDTVIVMIGVVLTVVVCISVIVFTFQNKVDFTLGSGVFFVLLMLFIFYGGGCLVTYHRWGHGPMMRVVYGGLGAAVIALSLVFDSQFIIEKERYEISSPEDYIASTLALYSDFGYIVVCSIICVVMLALGVLYLIGRYYSSKYYFCIE